ncbi:MAG: MOSC domain-containing protein [Betaproteobacteria bacterium]
MRTLSNLMLAFPQQGTLEWIGLRPQRRAPMQSVESAEAIAERGLSGDHRAARIGGNRQVTLIQREHLASLAKSLGCSTIDPALLRRNLVVSGIDLAALLHGEFAIGEVVLVGTGTCTPCARMDQALGPGGRNAMSGRGGITARVVRGGVVRLQDRVSLEK